MTWSNDLALSDGREDGQRPREISASELRRRSALIAWEIRPRGDMPLKVAAHWRLAADSEGRRREISRQSIDISTPHAGVPVLRSVEYDFALPTWRAMLSSSATRSVAGSGAVSGSDD